MSSLVLNKVYKVRCYKRKSTFVLSSINENESVYY